MTEIVLRPLADAFMQVGVFVALLVAPFGWARHRWGTQLDALLVKHRKAGPVIAAALTMPPGCGGAIIVIALYARGAVSYGAAVAALVATMGDATWLLLAADPVLTLQLKVLLLATGAVSGLVVDGLGISPRLPSSGSLTGGRPSAPSTTGSSDGPDGRMATALRSLAPVRATTDVEKGAATVSLPGTFTGMGLLAVTLWCTLALAATVVPATFHLLDPAAAGRALFGGVDPYLALGLLGAGVCLIAFVASGCRVADDDDHSAHPRTLGQVLEHSCYEVAFITVWVSVAYVAWSVLSHLTGFDGTQLPLLGLLGVVAGALVGLIPGCGIQLVFMGIFLAGGMPVSTLVANSISQDGDALLPLMALAPRSALLAATLTTVPALLVGAAMVLLSG